MTAYTEKYLMGHCHGLAYVLSQLTDKPVGVLYAHTQAGRRINDPMHVYVNLGDGKILDIKGERTQAEMRADFEGLSSCLASFGHYENETLDDPESLYSILGMNPESAEFAAKDILRGDLDFLLQSSSLDKECIKNTLENSLASIDAYRNDEGSGLFL